MHAALVHRDLHRVTRGGICTVYRCLADELVQRGHRVTLVTQSTPHPLGRAGVDVVVLPRTEDLGEHRRAVADALDQIAPDVAECSTWDAELLAYLTRTDRAPVMIRGDLPAATMGIPHLARDERTLCHAADAVVAVSHFAAEALARDYRIERPAVLANGVDRRRFTSYGLPDGGPHLPRSGWRVRFDAEGHVTSRQALSEFIIDEPAWVGFLGNRPHPRPVLLVWVGKFTEMKGFDRLTRLIPRLSGLAQLVVVLGHGQVHFPIPAWNDDDVLVCQDMDDDDLPAVYRAANYLLSTSRWEGYGLAIAEALSCGTPALLPADLAVGPELIALGETGATWRDDDELLGLITTRPALVGALPDRYTWAENAAATLDLYAALLAARGNL